MTDGRVMLSATNSNIIRFYMLATSQYTRKHLLFSSPVPANFQRFPATYHIQHDCHSPFLTDADNKELHVCQCAFPKPFAVCGDRVGYCCDSVRVRATGFNNGELCALSL